jgi:hypothetical protein
MSLRACIICITSFPEKSSHESWKHYTIQGLREARAQGVSPAVSGAVHFFEMMSLLCAEMERSVHSATLTIVDDISQNKWILRNFADANYGMLSICALFHHLGSFR